VGNLARDVLDAVLWLLIAAGLAVFTGSRFLVTLATIAVVTYGAALLLRAVRSRAGETGDASRFLLLWLVGAQLATFVWLSLSDWWGPTFLARMTAPLGLGVVTCHAIAYLVDVHRREAETGRPLRALLYVLQLPVIIAGPLSRYREFTTRLPRAGVSLGAFAYGMRRMVTGLIKAVAVGTVLARAADAIFAVRPAALTMSAAWLGAVCVALQVYVQFSGFCDVSIGVGRMIGFRYPENFRRPYTADSIREFWRRWNVTLITWLRDYLYLPIAGHDKPTPRLFVVMVAGFCLVGLWHGGQWTFLLWGIYGGTWLALEEVGLRERVTRWPAAVRHAYVIGVVVVGWTILRAPDAAAAAGFLKAMAGLNTAANVGASRYSTTSLWLAVGVGLFAAGPLVPSISRWRVSIDAATTSVLMMTAATGVFLWRGPSLALRSVWPSRPRP